MKKMIIVAAVMVLSLLGIGTPVLAASGQEKTMAYDAAILTTCGDKADDSNGEGVMCILTGVMDIMTIGIGILGVLGITIVGIQYLTAGDNEDKTRKAKRRMLEIVIGLVAYVLIYAFLKFLIPGFSR